MERHRTMIRTLLGLLLALALSPVRAQAAPPVDGILVIPGLIDYTTATSTAGCTVGLRGCIVSASFNGVTSVSVTPGSSLGQPPYPAPLNIDLYDSGSNGTLVCSAAVISGITSTGKAASETVSSLTESGKTTANAWKRVQRVHATGCSGGGASDVLRVSVGDRKVGLPVHVDATDFGSSSNTTGTGITQVCYRASGAAWRCTDGSDSNITRTGDYITLGSVSLSSVGITDGASLMIMARGYPGK